MVLYAYTAQDIVTPAEALAYLLEGDNWWLWNFHTEREKYRLLHKVWPELTEKNAEKLVGIIVAGPPREMYRENLTEEKWRKAKDRAVWHLLAKLAFFDRELTPAGQNAFENLSRQYPKWQLPDDESDEFCIWMGKLRSGYKCDLSLGDLLELSPEKMKAKLVEDSENSEKYHEGRIALFKTFCKDHSEKACDVLELLFRDSLWENKYQEIWQAALIGMREAEEKQFSRLAPWLQQAPAEFYQQEAWGIACYLEKVTEDLNSDDEELLWDIFSRVLDNSSCTELSEDGGAWLQVINSPVGMLAELLILRLGRMGIKAKAGIPQDDLRDALERLNTEEKFVAGRMMLASRLHYFHWLDPDWTKEHLLGRMSWNNPEEAKFLWQGYLHNAKIDVDLFLDIKEELIAALDNVSLLGDFSEHLFQLIAIILLSLPLDSFTETELREILRNIGSVGRKEVAETFLRSRRVNNTDETDESFWSHRLKPLLSDCWPKDNDAIDSITSQQLARLAVRAGDKFPEALQTVQNIIGSVSDMYSVVSDLNNSNLPQNYCTDVFNLLGMIFTENCQCSQKIMLRKLMEKLIKHCPEHKNNPVYNKIDRFLQGS
ncbi:MAG: hypothetical protein D3924_14360 [Candidatus Electrothrix sp. AR4]|nr:hypothetical protein [Candidatus Electrothrix sp. AR4]